MGNSHESLNTIVDTITNLQDGYTRDPLLDRADRRGMIMAAANIKYRLCRVGGGGNGNSQGGNNSKDGNSPSSNSPSGTYNNNSSSVSTNTRASFPRIRFDQLMSFC